ncbi:MAG: hypothetical protein IKG22_07685, partial [Atopobiaceae bacterium]|nr:hypothetical protein [Atopobiaceae bacterium]
MKRIRLEELLANIRVNLVAFLSIALFVCLGVGLFMGLRWGGIAVRTATQQEFEKGNMHDVEVQFPSGLTKENLEQLHKVEGVDDLEVGYSSFVTLNYNNTGQTFKLQSLTQRIDVPTSVEGRLPTKKGEIALLSPWCKNNNVKVGDTFTFVHDADEMSLDLNTGTKVEDKDGMAYLTTDTFVLTAIVDMPSYLAKLSDSYGVSNSASGMIDCVGLVTTDAFDESKFQDGFTNAYVRCNELEGINTFSPEYSKKIAPIVTAITDLGGELATARYDELHGRMQSKLDEGQQKVDDGQKQLEEGQQKIDDGEKQLEEGKKKLEDGQNQLVSGLSDASEEQAWAQDQLDDAYRLLSDGQAKYDAGIATYNMASDLYNQIRDKFADVRGSYDLLMNLATNLRPYVSELAAAIDEFEAAVDNMNSDPSPENQAVASGKLVSLKSIYENVRNTYGSMIPEASLVEDATGIPISVRDMDSISDLGLDDASEIISIARNAVSMADQMLTELDTASITVGDVTVTLNDIPGSLTQVYNYLTSTKATLEASRTQLEEGWGQYYQKKAEY